MKIALYRIANQIGMHPVELAKIVLNGDVTGEVPNRNAQSKDAWVDLLSLRNYVEWTHDRETLDELRYRKYIRYIDSAIRKAKS